MLSPTLTEGLKRYSIGEKLRSLRLRKKIGLVGLGKHTGLSPALLSKIERGRLFPTLPTLLRIAMVFSVGLEYFFTDERQHRLVAVVRQKDRQRFPEKPDGRESSFHFECLDYPAVERKLNAYYAEFQPTAAAAAHLHQHPGVEFLYLLQGKLELHIDGEATALEKGDAIYFDSHLAHGYRRVGGSPCAAIVVTMPG